MIQFYKHAYYKVTFLKKPINKNLQKVQFFDIILATQIQKILKIIKNQFFLSFLSIRERKRKREKPWKAFLRRSVSVLGEGTISGSFNEAMKDEFFLSDNKS